MPAVTQPSAENRFSIEIRYDPSRDDRLAEDVRRGLGAQQKSLPPKYFYDEVGSRLFDEICRLPEYYPTRTERALLEDNAEAIIATTRPSHLIELGSGTSSKTRILLDAATAVEPSLCYHPVDVCAEMLEESGEALLERYPHLTVSALAADYEADAEHLPEGERRLVAFLGSTIGNFGNGTATQFLARVGRTLRAGEWILVGVDLVKSKEVLEAAYNDSQGVTAAFNRNVLHVINRELEADFDPNAFEHVAHYNEEQTQIEMHLRARHDQTVTIDELDLAVPFRAGETILTEVSRKFTRERVEEIYDRAGFELTRWFTPANGFFALALGKRTQRPA